MSQRVLLPVDDASLEIEIDGGPQCAPNVPQSVARLVEPPFCKSREMAALNLFKIGRSGGELAKKCHGPWTGAMHETKFLRIGERMDVVAMKRTGRC